MTKSNLGSTMVYLAYISNSRFVMKDDIRTGTQMRQKLVQRPWRTAAHWLVVQLAFV